MNKLAGQLVAGIHLHLDEFYSPDIQAHYRPARPPPDAIAQLHPNSFTRVTAATVRRTIRTVAA